ncbi:MAG TPA: hypothetical protein PKD09_16205, partial [Aggregatilinea sp.]
EERGVPLSGVPLDALREISEQFTEDVSAVFDFRAAAARRKAPGGAGDYDGQMRRAEAWLASQKL